MSSCESVPPGEAVTLLIILGVVLVIAGLLIIEGLRREEKRRAERTE